MTATTEKIRTRRILRETLGDDYEHRLRAFYAVLIEGESLCSEIRYGGDSWAVVKNMVRDLVNMAELEI